MCKETSDVIREFTKEISLQEYLGQRGLAQQLAYANSPSTTHLDTIAMAEEIVKLRAKVAALPPAPKVVRYPGTVIDYRIHRDELESRVDAFGAEWSRVTSISWNETMRGVLRELLAP